MPRLTRRGLLGSLAAAPVFAARDQRLERGFRAPERNGWIYVRLEGKPSEIGYQHGYLLAREIATAHRTIAFEMERDTKKPWSFYKKAGKDYFWPKLDAEYQEEITGIAEGLAARGTKLDVWDMVAMNAWLEWSPYFTNWYDKNHGKAPTADRCSAFVATGPYTADGRPVMGHNAWTGYANGVYWNIVFEINPVNGHRILMDGYPGLIHSGDDFGLNTAGMMITETTITQFDGFDPDGIPEFMRARKAMQYSASIDDFARHMRHGNNGGYANNWLVADNKTGEVASLELGLRHVTLRRAKDGYFCGANFPVNETMAREETQFDMKNPGLSPNARRVRWEQLMAEHKGRIDLDAGKRFLSDHYDVITKSDNPGERTLCGHNELSPRGMEPWQPPFGAAGAVQAKVTTAALAEKLTIHVHYGHSCGRDFKAAEHLKKHSQFAWQKGYLKDLPAKGWAEFSAAAK